MSSTSSSNNASFLVVIITIVSGFTAGTVWRMDNNIDTLVDRPTPTVTVTAQPTGVALDDVLGTILPYYQQAPPDWCAEDMTCWIGTSADGRSPREVWDALESDVASSEAAYGHMTWTEADATE